jgi:hypothetical protein
MIFSSFSSTMVEIGVISSFFELLIFLIFPVLLMKLLEKVEISSLSSFPLSVADFLIFGVFGLLTILYSVNVGDFSYLKILLLVVYNLI